MNFFKPLYVILFISSIFLNSCKKDLISENTQSSQPTSQQSNQPYIIKISDNNGIGGLSIQEGVVQTVLGEVRINPFTVSNIEQAQSNLYSNPTVTITPTDLYVKFTPSSLEELSLIGDADIFYVDFPLDREVIEMGEYYQDIPDGSYPILYAVVSADFIFPEVSYDILDELYLSNSNPALIAESFMITGNEDELVNYSLELSEISVIDLDDDFISMMPPIPTCNPGCYPTLRLTSAPGVYPMIWEYYCKCVPPNPGECELNGDLKKPSGKFQVWDTHDREYKGVFGIEVHFWNGWFTFKSKHTNQYGCFKESQSFPNKMYMWVKFKNYQAKITGIQNGHGLWQWSVPYTAFIEYFNSNDVINHIDCDIDLWSTIGSKNHLLFGASTVSNALREFRMHAASDLISLPPNRLNIFLDRNNFHGAGIMASQGFFSAANLTAIATSAYLGGPLAASVIAFGVIRTQQIIPDLIIGIPYRTSDGLKSLAFHEIAHASHYQLVGSTYWSGLIMSEVAASIVNINQPHGTASSPGAGKISICESWADYISFDYVERTYVASSSIYGQYSGEFRWFETTNHVPSGLHWDLADNNNEIDFNLNPPARKISKNEDNSGSYDVIDNVHGFTNQMMFNSLDNNTIDIFDYKNTLISNHLGSTPNSLTDVNTLFSSYNN